jgi:rhamnosyltransferase
MNHSRKVSASVVLYNPSLSIIDNILSYSNQVTKLYVVDNSETPNNILINQLSRINSIELIQNNENLGIAEALNIAAGKAIRDGFDFLLTMDQDTSIPAGMVNELFTIIQNHGYNLDEIGIISPFQRDSLINSMPKKSIEDDLLFVITSGNLLNLKAFSIAGDFRRDLFIDRVDHDFCLRLKMHGYKIIRVNSMVVEHHLGNISKHSFFGRVQYTTNHSYIRRYYIFRNTLYVSNVFKNSFPEYSRKERSFLLYEIVKIILFEKDKLMKLAYCYKGFVDYKKNRMGKLKR